MSAVEIHEIPAEISVLSRPQTSSGSHITRTAIAHLCLCYSRRPRRRRRYCAISNVVNERERPQFSINSSTV